MACPERSGLAGADTETLRIPCNRVVARWRLTQAEVRSLLGLTRSACSEIVPGHLDAAAEWRADLIVRVDRALFAAFGDVAEVCAWVRSPSRALGSRTPLEAMANPTAFVACCRNLRSPPWPNLVHLAERS